MEEPKEGRERRLWGIIPKRFSPVEFSIKNPVASLVIVTVITLLIGSQALNIEIKANLEVYMPPDDPTVKTLDKVREEWSADVVIIYVEAREGYNLTNVSVLREMSEVELELDPYGQNPDFDNYPSDRGENDSIVFTISISTLIKTLNVTPQLVTEAIAHKFPVGIENDQTEILGTYEIPNQQEVNQIMDQTDPEDLKAIMTEDRKEGVIIFGVRSGADQVELLKRVNDAIKGKEYSNMTPTGTVVLAQAISKKTQSEFREILPITLITLMLVLIIFHRTPKIVLLCLLPTLFALIMTFGILGSGIPQLMGMVITPQIVIVGPLLLSLGVAYGLYIANRYAEGGEENKKVRMQTTVKAIHAAILLSAVTTSVGFASLIAGGIPPMIIMGFSLTIGIMLCYALTMVMVPALTILLNYKKRTKLRGIKGFSRIPVENSKRILTIVVVIVILSLSLIPSIETDVDYTGMAPSDLPEIEKLREYSEKMGGGQIGMVLISGKENALKDVDVLEDIDELQMGIKDEVNELGKDVGEIKNSRVFSIIDVMKMIKTPDQINVTQILSYLGFEIPLPHDFPDIIYLPANVSFWEIITASVDTGNPAVDTAINFVLKETNLRDDFIDIFYDSMTGETEDMLVSEQYSKTMIYIFMPNLPISETRELVNGINKAIDKTPSGNFNADHLTGTAAILLALNDLLITSQLQSLIVTLFLCFLVVTIVFRSMILGAITVIPTSIVIAWEPMIFVSLGIPLSIITVMIASITIGTGIDYSIQITQRVRREGISLASVRKSVDAVGISFVEATGTILAGYATVLYINVESIREFIMMVMMLLGFNAIVALVVLPAIYAYVIEREIKRRRIYGR